MGGQGRKGAHGSELRGLQTTHETATDRWPETSTGPASRSTAAAETRSSTARVS